MARRQSCRLIRLVFDVSYLQSRGALFMGDSFRACLLTSHVLGQFSDHFE